MKTETKNTDITIGKIADRAEALFSRLGIPMPTDRMSLIMDIEFTNYHMTLDLERLLTFRDEDFAHDIGGILCHFNRETLKMDDNFIPRSIDMEAELSEAILNAEIEEVIQ